MDDVSATSEDNSLHIKRLGPMKLGELYPYVT